MNFKYLVLIAAAAVTLPTSPLTSVAQASDPCSESGRNSGLCRKMMRLMSDLNVLDADRDLLQANFSLMDAISTDIDEVVTRVLVSPDGGAHLAPISGVKAAAQELQSLARAKDFQALAVANQLRGQCLSCHSNSNPSSGHSWADISGSNWGEILSNCNSSGRNPYLCKSMYGLSTYMTQINSAVPAGQLNYEVTGAVAGEMNRIAADLRAKGAVHSSDWKFEELESKTHELVLLSRQRDPKVFDRSKEVMQSCLKCHGPIGLRARSQGVIHAP